MKKLFIFSLFCSILISCVGEGQPQSTNENYGHYKVEKLFTTSDSITIYRFYDNGDYHYFTNKTGQTIRTYSEIEGKTTYTKQEIIPTNE